MVSFLLVLISAFTAASAFTFPQSSTTTTRLLATWSDSKAVRDYQDFLNSGKQEIELPSDTPSVIVMDDPNNELARALYTMGGEQDLVVTPDQELPAEMGGQAEYPVYITLPPWKIDGFLGNLKESYKARPEDFVFFAGGLKYGNIEDILKNRGACIFLWYCPLVFFFVS